MTKWDGFPMLGFDIESTGVNVAQDRIVTAACHAVWGVDGQHANTKSYVVDPGIPIPEAATAVHGYTQERAATEATHPSPGDMLFELTGRLALAMGKGIPIVGANLAYDLTLLECENERHGVDTLVSRLGPGGVQPIVDIQVLDKFADPYRKGGRKLVDLAKTYGVELGDDAHDAGADTRAACAIWPRIMAKFPRKFPSSFTIHSLHQAQVGWRLSQMNSLRGYFDKSGKEHDGCCGEWPLHRVCLPKLAAAKPSEPDPEPVADVPPFRPREEVPF